MKSSGHDHPRNSVVLFIKKLRNSYEVAPSASAILSFFLRLKACILKGLRGALSMEDRLLANMSQQRVERKQFEDIGGSGQERRQSQIRLRMDLTAQTAPHKCVLVLHQTESVICSKNTVTCTNRMTARVFFSDYSHTRCESAARDPVTGVLRMSEQDAQSHTRCAHPHTNFLADKTLTALVQWCGAPRMQPLAR